MGKQKIKKWHWEDFVIKHPLESVPVPIVTDAGMANAGVADGKLLPVIIVDTLNRPDIEDMINAHSHCKSGDVSSVWAKTKKRSDHIRLILEISNPSNCFFILEFYIPKQGIIVDQIISTGGFYLQSGREGDRLSTTLDHPKLLVEVPSHEFRDEWENLLQRSLEKNARRKWKLSNKEAREYSKELINTWREKFSIRIQAR